MSGERVRWRNVREFLDDLPRVHCTAKPPHEFCTVCMRINYRIAHDCPLFHQHPKRKARPLVEREVDHEPIKDHVSTDDVVQVLKGEDFPIIEFAGPRGGGHDSDEEEIIEVQPIEVSPLEEKPPKVARSSTAPKVSKKAGDKTTPITGKPDPEQVVQEIMEELEFPTEEPEEGIPEPKEEPGDEDEGAGEEEGTEPKASEPEPPKVSKEAVVKRKPKTKDED
jgi:hypothetical protein